MKFKQLKKKIVLLEDENEHLKRETEILSRQQKYNNYVPILMFGLQAEPKEFTSKTIWS